MEKFKENLKKYWKISLIIFVLVCMLGVALWIVASRSTGGAISEAYTVEVTDSNGKSVEEVYLVLCAEDGTEISWLPYVTNNTGKAQFSDGVEEGCYVKVVGVPFGYQLDESVKYTFNEEGIATIVLSEDDSVYVAKIGETVYASLTSALAVANASSDDVTIELLADTTLKTFTIKNNYGKTVTINGNGHVLTAEGGNNTFVINQEEGTIAFENMTIKHKNTGAAIQTNGLVTVNVTDVVIDATGGNAYNYALINTLGVSGTTTLNLTRVDAKMAVGSPAKADQAGIIRTGNTSGTKNVEINLVDCNFDTTGATGRQCIVVMKNTVANINATNSTFKSGDSYAIWAQEQSKAQTLTMTNCQASADLAPYAKEPIKGYFAKIGNTYYLPLSAATDVANASKKNVTLELICDVTIKTCTINNKNGKLVTIDGKGKTITTEKGNNAFVVGNNVAFKNMTINHKNTGSAIHVTTAGNVTATDVFIKATEGTEYTYTLVNTLAEGKTTLNFTRVKATMAVETAGKSNPSIIRTGNSGVNKTIVMNLTDCNFDTTKATGRSGITITDDATTTVNLKNTTIKTMDTFAIRSNEEDINWNNADTTLTSSSKTYQDYPVEGYLAKIGDVFYTFAGALDVANVAKADTTIKMLANYTIKTYDVNNTNGKIITIDGNGKTFTTKSGNNAFVVGNNVTFKNMTINHKNYGSAIQINEVGTVNINDVVINATEPGSEGYRYALINLAAEGTGTTLNMNGVDVTMSVAGRGKDSNSAVIRTGNGSSDAEPERGTKTVAINLTDCNFDTTNATGRSGIVVMNTTTANISLTDTAIKTLDVAPIKSNASTKISQTIVLNNETLSSVTKEFNNDPIRGYEAQVGNTVYRNMQDALKAANAATEDVTVKVVYDFSRGVTFNINNTNGKAVTIDGDGHTVTASGGTGNNAFVIGSDQVGDVEIKNMDIVHKNRGSVVQIASKDENKVNVKVTDVTIDATTPKNTYTSGNTTYTDIYSYALINMTVSSTLELNNVDVDMDVETAGIGKNKEWAIIRTGNSGDNNAKTVEIKLVDCYLDATGAVDRYGILIMDTTDATVDMQNTKIGTMNVNAIRECNPNVGQVTVSDDSDFVCGKKADEHTGYAIQVGNTWYVKYGAALLEAAKTATEDVTITLAEDVTIALDDLKNVNGKTITIDTNGNCLTTTGAKDDTVVISSEAQATIGEETFYASLEGVVKQANAASQNVRIELLVASEVNLTDVNNTNGKKITIDTNGKRLTTTGTLWSTVSIVSQTKYVSGTKTLYVKLTDALAEAKEASDDVTITVMTNVTVKEGTQVNNVNGKTITIDGNNKGYTVTTEKNGFNVNGECTVRFVNMKIAHTGTQATVAITAAANVSLENVEINATKSSWQYGVINVNAKSGAGEKVTLDMNQVYVTMNVTAGSGSSHGIVRVDKGTTKIVDIDIENSNLNTSTVSNIKGICIQDGTTVDVTVEVTDTIIAAKNAVPIHDGSNKAVINKTRCELSIADGSNVAQVGNTLYESFADALTAAKASDKAVTIDLLDDLAISKAIVIENANQKEITIDGNMYDISTTVKNAIQIKSATKIKNVNIEHDGEQAAIQVAAVTTVDITDVEMTASTTGNTNFKYALINLLATGNTTVLNLTRVDVTMETGTYTDSKAAHAVVRTGNGNSASQGSNAKSVKITLDDCEWDLTEAPDRSGILVMDTTTAEIILKNGTKISTQNSAKCAPIYAFAANTTAAPNTDRTVSMTDDCELKLGTSTTQADVIKNIAANKITVVATGTGAATMSLEEEPKTKTLILEVPAKLYDALVDWIKQFAKANGWDSNL